MKKILILLLFFVSSVFAQETIELSESGFNHLYNIPTNSSTVIISGIQEKDKFLFFPAPEINVDSQEEANQYFFSHYQVKTFSPVIVNREKNKKYLTSLEISRNILDTYKSEDFYNLLTRNPQDYRIVLLGKNDRLYHIDFTRFELERQRNFFTDYDDMDYNLAMVPMAKNVTIRNSGSVYAFRDGINFYLPDTGKSQRIKLHLNESSKRTQIYNFIYIDFSKPEFITEIYNPDFTKDTLYAYNVDIEDLAVDVEEKEILIYSPKNNPRKLLRIKNFKENHRKILLCSTTHCVHDFVSLEEILKR